MAAAHLDPGSATGLIEGDRLGLAIQDHPSQVHAGTGVEAPARRQGPGDAVAHAEALAVEIQPEATLKAQLVRLRLRITAADDVQMQRHARGQAIGGQGLPVRR